MSGHAVGVAPVRRAESLVVAFARVLREAGLDVPVGATLTFADAVGELGAEREASVYWAGRATLVRRPDDIGLYDRAFARFWKGVVPAGAPATEPPTSDLTILLDDADDLGGGEVEPIDPEAPFLQVRYSPHEVLRQKDFAAYSPAELDEARRLMTDLRLAGALRRSRRLRPVHHSVGRPDLGRTMRRMLRSGGEPVRWSRLAPSRRPRRLVLLCDVSGSMEPYARALMRLAHAAVVGRGRVEAFALGTRLTRLTRELSSRDPDAALRQAGEAVVDWSGGTRLGEGLRGFNDRWGCRGMARGAVVVILSDGWDRGDPELLGEQMARLSRVAYKVVWVNPLKATPGYAPVTRGMAVALPYVDEFVEGHSLASLEKLAEVINR
ncbi:MAG: vWA domain-containing protein [Acidimicrobiales bacterium]